MMSSAQRVYVIWDQIIFILIINLRVFRCSWIKSSQTVMFLFWEVYSGCSTLKTWLMESWGKCRPSISAENVWLCGVFICRDLLFYSCFTVWDICGCSHWTVVQLTANNSRDCEREGLYSKMAPSQISLSPLSVWGQIRHDSLASFTQHPVLYHLPALRLWSLVLLYKPAPVKLLYSH